MQEEFVRKSRQILAGLCVTPPLRIFWRFMETMHLRARYADQISKYQKRISGLLLDRIDTACLIEVPRVDYEKLSGDRMGSLASPFVPVSKPRAIYRVNVSRVTAHPILFVTRICESGRSDNFASCRLALSRAEGVRVRV